MRKVLIIGHSHLRALMSALPLQDGEPRAGAQTQFLFLRDPQFALEAVPGQDPAAAASALRGVDRTAIRRTIRESGADATILYLNGNGHNVFGIFRGFSVTQEAKLANLRRHTLRTTREWLRFLVPLLSKPVAMLLPPPPLESEALIRASLESRKGFDAAALEIEPAQSRLALWAAQCSELRTVCEEAGVGLIEPPAELMSPGGFLRDEFLERDPTHANAQYGARVLQHALETMPTVAAAQGVVPVGGNPYDALPEYCFWRQSMSEPERGAIDPVAEPKFRVRRTDRVATAGSCFAQHISRRLREADFNFLVSEEPAPGDDANQAKQRGFYDFSARYGNVYTARQLLQLFERAFGYFSPPDRVWKRHDGGYCDPFRPRIEPEGFPSEDAVIADTRRHFAAVRRMFRQLDVFVFTLGLTECWISKLDGAAYPLCPGVAGGEFDPRKHAFVNFGVSEVIADLQTFLARLRLVNARARVILTVSPVPLIATASGDHVLEATTYSKSVLRVAAGEIASAHDHVCYFPSYEIITGPHAGGAYFEADRRSVATQGVDHVMRVFMSRLTEASTEAPAPVPRERQAVEADAGFAQAQALAEALCDEEMLAR